MIKLIVFDWDDVFTLGSKRGYFACYDYTLEHVGVTLPDAEKSERILGSWGMPHQEVIRSLLSENPELVDEAITIHEKALFGHVFANELEIVPGAVDMLAALSKEYTLALVSGLHPSLFKPVFKRFNVPAVFEMIVSFYEIEDLSKIKPSPYALQRIMKQLNFAPTETIMIGDAENDMLMAKNAGVGTVAVLTGHLSREEAEALDLDHIIADVARLPSVLESK